MNRSDFGAWGMRLDAVRFARALAGLGLLQARQKVGSPAAEYAAVLQEAMHRPAARWELPSAQLEHGTIDADAALLSNAWVTAVESRRNAPVRPPPLRLQLNLRNLAGASPGWLLDQLSLVAVGVDGIHVGHPRPAHRTDWSWPLQVGMLESMPPGSPLARLEAHKSWLTDQFVEFARLGTSQRSCDLLLLAGPLAAAAATVLAGDVRAACVMVIDQSDLRWAVARPLLEAIAAHTQAAGVALAEGAADPHWLDTFLEELSHDGGIDVALLRTARSQTKRPPLLLCDSRLIEETRVSQVASRLVAGLEGAHIEYRASASVSDSVAAAPPPSLLASEMKSAMAEMDYSHEYSGAHSVARISRAARPALNEPPRPRWIKTIVTLPSDQGRLELERALAPDSVHEVQVYIGPREGKGVSADVEFPIELLNAQRGHRLTVVFSEPHLMAEPQTAEIWLPAVGPSKIAVFRLLTGPAGQTVEARIAVLYQNRVLQTARLSAAVAADYLSQTQPPYELKAEAALRLRLDDLSDRASFDGALILNHDRHGLSGILSISGRHAELSTPIGLETAVDAIRGRLEQLVTDDKQLAGLDDPRLVELLVFLARHGSMLHSALAGRLAAGKLEREPRIQVLAAEPTAYLPVEFFYDHASPKPDAHLCERAKKALEATGCAPDCPSRADSGVVCPLGFWGLNRVIERHAADNSDPDVPPWNFALAAEPVSGRNRLRSLSAAVLGTNQKVDGFEAGSSAKLLAAMNRATGDEAKMAATWKDWTTNIAASSPPLLVVLPHTVSDSASIPAMEIGTTAQLPADQVDETYVGTDKTGPIVILLGCTTAAGQIPYEEFPARFRLAGAAIVLGTLTKVLGRHAAPVALQLVEALAEQTKQETRTFGDVMLKLRRQMLLGGAATVLAVVPYGDADWLLGT